MRRASYLLFACVLTGLSVYPHASGLVARPGEPSASAALASMRMLSPRQAATSATVDGHTRFLRLNCLGCHNERLKIGNLALDTMDLGRIGEQGEVWEKVVRKLRAGVMPPVDRPRPDPAAQESFVGWLEGQLDAWAQARPDPGEHERLHRLNRTEYQNAIRDLLDLQINAKDFLPADDVSHGFDNIAGTLKLSPALIERYVTAAQKIGRLAVGLPPLSPVTDTFRLPGDLSQVDRLDGLPLGTRGGIAIPYNFPQNAEYEIGVELLKNRDGSFYLTETHELEVSIDGARVEAIALTPPRRRGAAASSGDDDTGDANPGGKFRVRAPVTAGPHTLAVTFVKKTAAAEETLREPFLRVYNASYVRYMVAVGNVSVTGPFNAAGAGETPSRRRLFVCTPANRGDEAACARTILSALARHAYRRSPSAVELQELLDAYQTGSADNGFESGVEAGVQRVLASPHFLLRVERASVPSGTTPGAKRDGARAAAPPVHRISDVELASRLSFFLWSSIPDDTLLDLASRGRLNDPAVLEQQVRRMLAAPQAESLATSFASQWLHLRNLPAAVPFERMFPDFDENLRRSLRRETELLFDSIVREDRSVVDLLTADYTFLNERSARHYGVDGVYGDHFRRVQVADDRRRGLLGHGSIMTVTSQANRTSPVVRGKWILENLLGTPPPPPPPNVPPLDEGTRDGKTLSMRERMVQHRANPVCASCHAVMDPLGLSLENFDAVGQWRDRDAGAPIDASGSFPDGTKFDGVVGLRHALVARSDLFVATMTEKLLIYALGRGLTHVDAATVRAITRDAARHDYALSSVILGIVNSTPFQMRRTQS